MIFSILSLLLWQPGAFGQEQNLCLVCHSEVKVDYIESVHATFGVVCKDCHGGDPNTLDQSAAHAPEASFKGRPSRAEIPTLCASCHSDPIRMKPYGLRIDQYAEYQTSQHGQLLARGDTNVAICTDCHMSHRILPASEPRSTVHPENISNTCARCHSDQALMGSYDIPTDQFEGFLKGAHGIALLEQGNTKAPNCATCHGIHGAMPPRVEDVSKVCGICHINERVYFNASPHKKAMDERKFEECASCHGNHEVTPTDRRLFDMACLGCHSQSSKEFLTGQKIKALLLGAQEALKEAESALEQARKRAFDVEAYKSRMIEAKAYLIQALVIQHSLDVSQVEELTRRARSIADDARAEAYSFQTAIHIRWLGLALIWGYILLTMVTIYLYKRERRRAQAQGIRIAKGKPS